MSLIYFDGMDQYMPIATPTTTNVVGTMATVANLTTVASDPIPFFMDSTKNTFVRIKGEDRVWRVTGAITSPSSWNGGLAFSQNAFSAPYSTLLSSGYAALYNFLTPVSDCVHITAGFKMKVAYASAGTNPNAFSASQGFLLAAFSTTSSFEDLDKTFGVVIGDNNKVYIRKLVTGSGGFPLGIGYTISDAFPANTFVDADASGYIGTCNFVFSDCYSDSPSTPLNSLASNTVEVQYTAAGKVSVWINNMFAGTATFANPAPYVGTKFMKIGAAQQAQNFGNGGTAYAFIGYTDLYMLNGLGTRNNSRLGKVKVVSRAPAADAAVQFVRPDTSNTNAVVASQLPAKVTPSLVGTKAGDTDLYSSSAFNFTNEAILGTAVFTTGYKTDPSGNDIAPVLNVSGTNYVGNTNTLPISSTLMKTDLHVYELNPKTGLPFTKTDLDATTFGVTVVAPPV